MRNSQPLLHDSPPLTTRPGLMPTDYKLPTTTRSLLFSKLTLSPLSSRKLNEPPVALKSIYVLTSCDEF